MDNLEYIESYFKGNNTDEQKRQFEKKIVEDAAFAEDVAFYISASGLVKEQLHTEKKQVFRDLYEQPEAKVISIRRPSANLWRYLAAASVFVAVIISSWFLFVKNASPQELADKYIQQNWQTLPVTMGVMDSLQIGLDSFNSNKLVGALTIFERLTRNNHVKDEANKYAGITSYRLGNYQKALKHFWALAADTTLFVNPGRFYLGITFSKIGDKDSANFHFQKVYDNHLEGENEAVKWLKK